MRKGWLTVSVPLPMLTRMAPPASSAVCRAWWLMLQGCPAHSTLQQLAVARGGGLQSKPGWVRNVAAGNRMTAVVHRTKLIGRADLRSDIASAHPYAGGV